MKSATVLIVGRPSAGKSTLLNRLCGEQVAVVASVPQTTRNRIRGVLTDPRGQIVLIDSPGLHASERKLNKRLRSLVTESLDEVDLILYLVDSRRAPGEEELAIANMLKSRSDRLLVALTKVDAESVVGSRQGPAAGRSPGDRRNRSGARGAPMPAGGSASRPAAPRVSAGGITNEVSTKASAAFLSEHLARVPVFPLSALTGEGIPALLSALFDRSPEGEAMYPEEFYTDQPPEFRIAEIIRGEALRRVREEVPHSLYVQIADLELPNDAEPEGGAGAEHAAGGSSEGPPTHRERKATRSDDLGPAAGSRRTTADSDARSPSAGSGHQEAGAVPNPAADGGHQEAGAVPNPAAGSRHQEAGGARDRGAAAGRGDRDAGQGRSEGRLWIRAFVVVERESQKGILVGRGGSMIKEIRVAAQREIARVFPYRIDLDLRVKIDPNWRTKDRLLDRLIY